MSTISRGRGGLERSTLTDHEPCRPIARIIRGREEGAEGVVDGIEHDVEDETGQQLERPRKPSRCNSAGRSLSARSDEWRSRHIQNVGSSAFACSWGRQFIDSGITFNLGSLFTTFCGVASATVPVFFIIYGIGNFLGPLPLGRLFDTIGRKPIIAVTYLGSALLTVPMAILFASGTNGKWAWARSWPRRRVSARGPASTARRPSRLEPRRYRRPDERGGASASGDARAVGRDAQGPRPCARAPRVRRCRRGRDAETG